MLAGFVPANFLFQWFGVPMGVCSATGDMVSNGPGEGTVVGDGMVVGMGGRLI